MPTIAPICRTSEWRITLIIRSVPMLPDPITATVTLRVFSLMVFTPG